MLLIQDITPKKANGVVAQLRGCGTIGAGGVQMPVVHKVPPPAVPDPSRD